jgi:hypothetical protein
MPFAWLPKSRLILMVEIRTTDASISITMLEVLQHRRAPNRHSNRITPAGGERKRHTT